MAAPDRELETKRRGLAAAREGNRARAALKQRIANGGVAFLDLVEGAASAEDEKVLLTARFDPILRAIPGVGPTTVNEIAADLGIDKTARWSTLTFAQRKKAADLLEAILRLRGLLR